MAINILLSAFGFLQNHDHPFALYTHFFFIWTLQKPSTLCQNPIIKTTSIIIVFGCKTKCLYLIFSLNLHLTSIFHLMLYKAQKRKPHICLEQKNIPELNTVLGLALRKDEYFLEWNISSPFRVCKSRKTKGPFGLSFSLQYSAFNTFSIFCFKCLF